MNNLYRKVAFASVCTALSFVLVANKEAKAAEFTLTPTTRFLVGDKEMDGLEDYLYGDVPLSVGVKDKRWPQKYPLPEEEYRAFYEFNMANLSLGPNTAISSAIFQTKANTISWYDAQSVFGISGYIGNGQADLSDFQAGDSLENLYFDSVINTTSEIDLSPIFSFNVLPFITKRIKNNDNFAGFGVGTRGGYLTLNQDASLTIITVDVAEPVPEPLTMLGAATALGYGALFKIKYSEKKKS